jgi:hypothetical protein
VLRRVLGVEPPEEVAGSRESAGLP